MNSRMSLELNSSMGMPGREMLPALQAAHTAGDGHSMHAPVLVLNASYEPINVCAARRAIVLVLKGVAMAEEENGHYLHAARFAIRVPSVIRLLEYRRIPHQSRALSRKNILLREPRAFNLHTSRHIMRLMGHSDAKWRKYLFY